MPGEEAVRRPAAARPTEQRKQDSRYRLEHDVDAWGVTAEVDGGVPRLDLL